jgi:hypothetical protein
MAAARLATRRWQDFTKALDALDAHERVMGRASPYGSGPEAA